MRGLERSTAIVPWSSLRAAAQRPGRNCVISDVFAAQRRIGNGSIGGSAFSIVGNFQFGRQTPEIVIAAGLLAENVDDEPAEIEQSPFGGAMAFAVFGRAAKILVQLVFDFRADGLHLRRAEAGTNNEEFRERGSAAQVKNGNPGGFFFLGGLDGESDTLWQRFEFHRYRPCLRMYSSTRAETSP